MDNINITLIFQILLGIGFLAVIGGMVYVGMRQERGGDPLEDRLGDLAEKDVVIESLSDVEMSMSFRDRVFLPAIEKLSNMVARFTPQKQLETSRKLIEMAGQNTDPTQFFLMRIGATIGLGVMGLMMAIFAVKASPMELPTLAKIIAAANKVAAHRPWEKRIANVTNAVS